MLLLLDYHTDCSDPAQLANAQENLEAVNDAFCDAMLSGENSSNDEGRDPDSPGRFENQLYPPMSKVIEEETPLWQEFVEAPLEREVALALSRLLRKCGAPVIALPGTIGDLEGATSTSHPAVRGARSVGRGR